MKITQLFLLVLVLILISGCTLDKKVKTLKIGTNSWPGYEALYLAQEYGFYKENINIKEFNSASEVLDDYRKGNIHAAALTLDEVIRLKEQGYSPLIVSVLDISNGGDSIISVSEINTMLSLKGKHIGVEEGALGAFMLDRALSHANMKKEELEIISLSINKHESAFKENIVDAVVTFEPVRTKLLNYGGNEIFSSSLIPNEIIDVLVIEKNYYNEEYVADILQALDVTVKKINNKDTLILNKMATRLGLSKKDLEIALKGLIIPTIKESNKIISSENTINTINKIQDIMYDALLISVKINTESLFKK